MHIGEGEVCMRNFSVAFVIFLLLIVTSVEAQTSVNKTNSQCSQLLSKSLGTHYRQTARRIVGLLKSARLQRIVGSVSNPLDYESIKRGMSNTQAFNQAERFYEHLQVYVQRLHHGQSLSAKDVARVRAIVNYFDLLSRSGDIDFIVRRAESQGRSYYSDFQDSNDLFQNLNISEEFDRVLANDTSEAELEEFSRLINYTLQEHNKLLKDDSDVYQHLNLLKAYELARQRVEQESR